MYFVGVMGVMGVAMMVYVDEGLPASYEYLVYYYLQEPYLMDGWVVIRNTSTIYDSHRRVSSSYHSLSLL